jgi:hypothetical protein
MPSAEYFFIVSRGPNFTRPISNHAPILGCSFGRSVLKSVGNPNQAKTLIGGLRQKMIPVTSMLVANNIRS